MGSILFANGEHQRLLKTEEAYCYTSCLERPFGLQFYKSSELFFGGLFLAGAMRGIDLSISLVQQFRGHVVEPTNMSYHLDRVTHSVHPKQSLTVRILATPLHLGGAQWGRKLCENSTFADPRRGQSEAPLGGRSRDSTQMVGLGGSSFLRQQVAAWRSESHAAGVATFLPTFLDLPW